jgi:hypothetical protein
MMLGFYFLVAMALSDLSLRIGSYNCRGFGNATKRDYVSRLLKDCDFLFLQEHWLAESQLGVFNDISAHHLAHAVCGFDNSEVFAGRPYGGCCIFGVVICSVVSPLLQLIQSVFVE